MSRRVRPSAVRGAVGTPEPGPRRRYRAAQEAKSEALMGPVPPLTLGHGTASRDVLTALLRGADVGVVAERRASSWRTVAAIVSASTGFRLEPVDQR